MADVFVSYASGDRERVRPLVEALEADGFSVWWDRTMHAGTTYDREIETAIADARCMVVAWSAHAVESEYVRSEVEEGARRQILVPVLIDDVLPPLAHRRRQAANLSHWSGSPDAEYATLLTGIRAVLDSGETPTDPAQPPQPTVRVRRRIRSSEIALGVLVIVLAIVAAVAIVVDRTPDRGDRVAPRRQFQIVLPDDAPLALTQVGFGGRHFALAPDATAVVYVSTGSAETRRLWVRPIDEFGAHPLPGTEGAALPFFSPDSKWVGYFVVDQLWKVSLGGGAPVALAQVASFGGMWWSDDAIIFTGNEDGALWQVPSTGGTPQKLPELEDVDNLVERVSLHRGLSMRWGDDTLLLPSAKNMIDIGSVGQITLAYSKSTGRLSPVLDTSGDARMLESGRAVFLRGTDLMATQFDTQTLGATTPPRLLIDGVHVAENGSALFDVAADGTIVYVPGANAALGQLVHVDRSGASARLDFPTDVYGTFAISPDGRRLVVAVHELTWDLWIFDLTTFQRERLTRHGNNALPVWSRDGSTIYFRSDREGTYALYATTLRNGETRLVSDDPTLIPDTISPDGLIGIVQVEQGRPASYFLLDPRADELTSVATDDQRNATLGDFSPDGRWLGLTDDQSGRPEVFVHRVDGGLRPTQVSFEGGIEPVWAADMSELYFWWRGTLFASSITIDGDAIAFGTPEVWLRDPAWLDVPGYSHQSLPTENGIIMLQMAEPKHESRVLHLIEGWQ